MMEIVKWRKWFRILHRDVGYLAFGLTVIYSISGIAVNHINDWNPNYVIENEVKSIPPIIDSTLSKIQLTHLIISELGITDSMTGSFRPNAKSVELFFKGKTISVILAEGKVNIEIVKSRYVFRESNYLHLNSAKGWWTWISDLFAVSLIFLAVTGIIMIKGKKGFSGRGKWLTAIGIIIPILYLIFVYY